MLLMCAVSATNASLDVRRTALVKLLYFVCFFEQINTYVRVYVCMYHVPSYYTPKSETFEDFSLTCKLSLKNNNFIQGHRPRRRYSKRSCEV